MIGRAVQSQVNYEAGKSPISIVALLEWAFQRECVSLDFSREGALGMVSRPAVSSSYLIARHAELGCRVDGGGHSLSHPDADLVADALVQLPAHVGGPRMAIWLAELARSGLTPDWCKDAQARCEPVEWRRSKHGDHAKVCEIDVARHVHRGRTVETRVMLCPVRYMNTADEVARVRRAYLGWWGALLELRSSFQIGAHLSAYRVTDEMPPVRPWQNSC
jgi:hypothetical protein